MGKALTPEPLYALTPFPTRGGRLAAVGSVHARGGRPGRSRGPPDPPKVPPGPQERAEGVPQRTGLPQRPILCRTALILTQADSGPDGHDETVNDGMSWSFRAATLARVSFHIVETA